MNVLALLSRERRAELSNVTGVGPAIFPPSAAVRGVRERETPGIVMEAARGTVVKVKERNRARGCALERRRSEKSRKGMKRRRRRKAKTSDPSPCAIKESERLDGSLVERIQGIS